MTASACKRVLSFLGLSVVVEKDAAFGHEFLVSDESGLTVAVGWHEGSKTDALNEALGHPAIVMRLQSAARRDSVAADLAVSS